MDDGEGDGLGNGLGDGEGSGVGVGDGVGVGVGVGTTTLTTAAMDCVPRPSATITARPALSAFAVPFESMATTEMSLELQLNMTFERS